MRVLAVVLALVACTKKNPAPPATAPVTPEPASQAPQTAMEDTGGCFKDLCASGEDEIVYIGNDKYQLKTAGVVKGEVKLLSDVGNEVERVVLTSTKDAYVVAWTENSGGDAGSKVRAFAKKDAKEIWTLPVEGFNYSQQRKENFLYVAAIGVVGKIDLSTGKYVWKKDGLYKEHNFNGAAMISLEGSTVNFVGNEGSLKVDDKTGKIL